MTRLYNDPKAFAAEFLDGFVAANSRYVQRVPGGVVRTEPAPQGQVALVLGGGSGHYPAFAGWVGPGMAHGAVCGNVFASPSASHVYSVARAADNGGGVLLGFGNYAGDSINFGLAAEQLQSAGVETRTIKVSDDLASNTPQHRADRRGIAGDIVVFKIAGAAAASGLSLEAVEQIARTANERTCTLGVAFAGCTLPGSTKPLFEVAKGRMALGLGIHGEPGLAERPMGSADEIADTLVQGVLAEEPPRGSAGYSGRVAVVVNGLGAVKYEELFIVYRQVARQLSEAGLTVVGPQVGEHVTSLDMAGLSLTLTYLDPQLERLWTAPVDTPALRQGRIHEEEASVRRNIVSDPTEPVSVGVPASRDQGAAIIGCLNILFSTAQSHEQEWGELDAIVGDGDHGQGMVLGAAGALKSAEIAASDGAGARTILIRAGQSWAESAGGTSGALWGSALIALGGVFTDRARTTHAEIVVGIRRAADAVVELGGAELGDKTLVDALLPFADALESAHAEGLMFGGAWTEAARKATEAAAWTSQLVARRGRARTHGEESRGHPDPGAVSFALLMTAIGHHINNDRTDPL